MNKLIGCLKSHKWFVIILIAYLLVNILFFIKHPGSIFNEPERFGEGISTYGSRDAYLYTKMAWQIINEGIYGYNTTESNAYVTPGQPFYLVAIIKIAQLFDTNHVMLYRLSNMMLNIGVLSLIYLISWSLFKKRSISIIASLIYATHISPLHMFRAALTEIPTLFLFMLTIYLFIIALKKDKVYLYALFGIIACCTLMFRATPAPLLLLAWGIVIYTFGFKKAVKIGFIWCIGPLVIIAPWVIRNLIVLHEFILFSSHAGGPLLAGMNAFQLQDFSILLNKTKELGITQEEYAKLLFKEGFSKDIPLYFSWFTVGKTLWLFMSPDGNPDGLGPLHGYLPEYLLSIYKWQNIVTAFGALLFAFLLRKQRIINMLCLAVLIYIVFSNMFLTLPRYGFIIYPILAIIFGYGIVHFSARLKMKLNKQPKKAVQ
ncbi:ArnT family glycosyltransferase [Peribacillus loiseleuriae]|uniref:ArnT family glycosyltransferase n=1 Tax=Peribacillus loiseleuriae TaxID=1679170 RepID=UPI003D081631